MHSEIMLGMDLWLYAGAIFWPLLFSETPKWRHRERRLELEVGKPELDVGQVNETADMLKSVPLSGHPGQRLQDLFRE